LLYSHIRNKAAMIDLVCEIITAQAVPCGVDGIWRERLTIIAHAVHRELGKYPGVPAWVLSQATRPNPPPEAGRLVGEVRRALGEAGLAQAATQAGYLAYAAYAMGHLMIAAGSPGSRGRANVAALFDVGLQQLLDGFEVAGRKASGNQTSI
jgi:hypothetical protein